MSTYTRAAQATSVRLYHLTFYKCGSQWVRDILADPRIVEHSVHRLAAGGIDLQSESWPALQPGQVAAPLYSAGPGDWIRQARPADRAFVVIRDPRDIIVSLVCSIACSHTPSRTTQLLRAPMACAAPGDRLKIAMFLFTQWAGPLRAWKIVDSPNALITRYEDLLADLTGELDRLFSFLEWPVPSTVVRSVASDNTFESRSKRKPGDENEFSHRRKGIAGDWRNHFTRGLGQLFEDTFPALLTDLGYERTKDWWQSLPETFPNAGPCTDGQRTRLLSVLEEHETEIAVLRTAAEERLAALNAAAAARRELENSVSWRFGYMPLRALGALLGNAAPLKWLRAKPASP